MTDAAQDLHPVKFASVNGAQESVRIYLAKARQMLDVASSHCMESREGVLKGMCQQAIADLFYVRDIFHRMCNQGHVHPESNLAEKAEFMVNVRNCVHKDVMKVYDEEFAFVLGAINSPFLYTDMPQYRAFQQAAAVNLRAALEVLNARINHMQGQPR